MSVLEEFVNQAVAELRGFADRLEGQFGANATATVAYPFDVEDAGEKIGRADANNKPLRVGDHVKVTGSSRYGSPEAFVVDAAEGHGSTGPRVQVALADGRNDSYTPSCGRVTRLARFGRDGHPLDSTSDQE